MISPRYGVAASLILALALVPTIIHSYVGMVVTDGLRTASIPANLPAFTSTPSSRDAGWGKRRFESDDWFERTYRAAPAGDEVLLTVLRSYDLKRLYHHPELDIAYGAGYLTHDIVELSDLSGVPVHRLDTDTEAHGTALYVLHYDGGFVRDPLWLQARAAGQLLFSGRKPMTLIFARDIRGQKGATPDTYPSAKVLTQAVRYFVGPAPAQ